MTEALEAFRILGGQLLLALARKSNDEALRTARLQVDRAKAQAKATEYAMTDHTREVAEHENVLLKARITQTEDTPRSLEAALEASRPV
jgi:hypothetical protein